MEDYRSYFKRKKITVMGLGLLGGLGDIKYLAEAGADLIVTDLKQELDLKPSLDALKEFSNIRYTLGKHESSDFQDRDLIIKAPSTPLDSPYIAEAKKNGIPVTMWAALFCRFARQIGTTIVGVTGTRGKTTTTFMIADILGAAGKKVIAGGNVQGTAMLPQLEKLTPDTIVVLELDSWKIQGFREENLSPNVSVFTTFYPDHLNYYGGSMDLYLADKAEIFLHQNADDTLVLGAQCAGLVREKYQAQIRSKVVVAHVADLPEEVLLQVPGEHNRYNAACALGAARALAVSDDVSFQALAEFRGVPGRLELVRDIRGVKIYNDTTATTPDATMAALHALDPEKKKNILLLMGGADKGLDMDTLLKTLPHYSKRIFLLAGTGTDHIKNEFPQSTVYRTLAAAVHEAFSAAESGDSILFSPAFASFGMFRNEYDRGDQFNALVKELR